MEKSDNDSLERIRSELSGIGCVFFVAAFLVVAALVLELGYIRDELKGIKETLQAPPAATRK